MHDKVFILPAYALIGLVMALWPLFATRNGAPSRAETPSEPGRAGGHAWWKIGILVIGALCMMQIAEESIISSLALAFGLVALLAAIPPPRFYVTSLLASFIALCASATLLWWVRPHGTLDVSDYQLVIFFLSTSAVIRLLTYQGAVRGSGSLLIWILGYSCIAGVLTFSTGIFEDRHAFRLAWHHWGAYVGPAELLLSGAAIFHDFPAQYGFGPTALIAGFCGTDCWYGMYFIAGFATLAYSILIAALALALTRDRWWMRLTVLILCLAVSFVWSGYPIHVSTPMMTPSVSGLRFLPVTVLLTYLFFVVDIGGSKAKVLGAQALWMLGVLWSPESAFYVTFLWWPYYLFVRRAPGSLRARVEGMVRPAANLLAALALLVVVFGGIYMLVYGEAPTVYGLLAYAIDPPGPLPINWHGAVWYFLLVTAVGLGTLVHLWRRTGDTPGFRRGFLVLLLSYGASSYFLGRSHDNNLLNILPFFLLVLLSAISAAESRFLTLSSATLAATLLGWLPLFGWQAWHKDVMHGGLLQFDSRMDEGFGSQQTDTGYAHDARLAIDYINQKYGEPITVFDNSWCLLRSTPPQPWSAIHGPENFRFMPSGRRREFLSLTAAALGRSGWVVVSRNFPADEWLADLDSAYRRDSRVEFGSYYAIRYVPKAR
jgi:hypothetical protein